MRFRESEYVAVNAGDQFNGMVVGGQALAVVTGLVLAVGQFLLSRRFLKHTTYLEKAFLGFLGAGTVMIFLSPPQTSSFFVQHSTSLLYLVLFVLVPPMTMRLFAEERHGGLPFDDLLRIPTTQNRVVLARIW